MSYYEKYLKYKNKYLYLKNTYVQVGGNEIITNKEEIIKYSNVMKDVKESYQLHIFNKPKEINIINIDLATGLEPVLVLVAGFSKKSFEGSSKVILKDIDKLKKKFGRIFMIEYSAYKEDQGKACDERDTIVDPNPDAKYQPEEDLNMKIAGKIDEILRVQLKLTNIHLLGKCNGGAVLIDTLVRDEYNPEKIYNALYLAVPGSYFNVRPLEKMSKDRLKEIKFIFRWRQQDAYQFKWGKSNEEKAKYEAKMTELGVDDCACEMYDDGTPELAKDAHEIDPKFVDRIVE